MWNSQSIMQQQQRLVHVLEIVQNLIALSILLAAQLIIFILDLVCLASRRSYLKLNDYQINYVNIKLRSLFDEYKFYPQCVDRELILTAQIFGSFFERSLF
ncbi:unnamed protein product [Rotaria sp. Silwood2]|nr:unnamed protein product [Rotaria sp. Silwood2]